MHLLKLCQAPPISRTSQWAGSNGEHLQGVGGDIEPPVPASIAAPSPWDESSAWGTFTKGDSKNFLIETLTMPELNLDGIRMGHEAGLHIWRIEKFKMVQVPLKSHGTFFEGDCYVVLSSRKVATSLRHDLHYWLGRESSQDEQGSVAIYSTQMDDILGGRAIQHREVQSHESELFRGYFKHGIIYKKGGLESGFNHVETNNYNVRRLLHVKGKKNITAMEVEISWDSINKGDVFLLDLGKVIIQWNGPLSNRMERLKGLNLAQDIRDRERGGRAEIGIIEGEDEGNSPGLMKAMEAVVGERRGELNEATSDVKADHAQLSSIKLYHISDETGSLVVKEVATRPLTQDLLNSTDCYILDQGGVRIFVWKGEEATDKEKKSAMSRALCFIKAKDYPASTMIETMADGAESAVFKQLFQKWMVKDQTVGFGRSYSVGSIAKVEQVKFDTKSLHAQPSLAAEHRMVDDGSGKVEVWRIEDLELQPVEKRHFGQFYGGDCYLILYTYIRNNKPSYVLYIWQGRHASKGEITASAYQAVALDQKHDGQPVQVRVTMGNEPRHFVAMFNGKLIIYQGGTSRSNHTEPDPPVRLFHIRGNDEFSTKAIEVVPRAAALNSNDVFVLKIPSACYLWCGKGANGDEREMAKVVADVISKGDKQTVAEGKEPLDFWASLGGKAPYADGKSLQEEKPKMEPRLFECSTQTGRFFVTEVTDFTQDDLDEDDVMLLDTWDEVLIWIGNGASEVEKKDSVITAEEYLRTHPSKRDVNTPIIIVKQGFEPPTFTGWFLAWDSFKWSGDHLYEVRRAEFGEGDAAKEITEDLDNYRQHNSSHHSASIPKPVTRTPKSPGPFGGGNMMNLPIFPLYNLLNKSADELPEGVDATCKEQYLSDDEFKNIMGVSKVEFSFLPMWKQQNLKKVTGLF
uniref:villin-1-like isoform X1 n=2 Tax=Myxine glutinosa TaxID=7769 RepID=UPI00358FAFE8